MESSGSKGLYTKDGLYYWEAVSKPVTLGQQQSITKRAIVRAIKLYAGYKYRTCGNSFATLEELKSICSDPLGWFELLRGYDAYEVLRLMYWHDLI